jgi:hypothetical protein
MNTFYFNTGVRPETVHNPEFPYEYHRKKGHVIRGTLLIPFDCDAPADSTLIYMCDNPDLPESKNPNVKVCEVFNSTMCSKYAYMRIK